MIIPSRHSTLRDAARAQVIEVATHLFHTQGIKNVTMDDIAHALTMSKRTLYQIFADKEDLLLACVVNHNEAEHERMSRLVAETDNVLDCMLTNFAMKMQENGDIKPSFFAEIVKYPKVMSHIEQYQREQEEEAVEFLNRGKEQGLFRSDVNFHIIYKQLIAGINSVLNDDKMSSYPQRDIFANTLLVYIRGCATLRGIELIDNFLQQFHTKLGFD